MEFDRNCIKKQTYLKCLCLCECECNVAGSLSCERAKGNLLHLFQPNYEIIPSPCSGALLSFILFPSSQSLRSVSKASIPYLDLILHCSAAYRPPRVRINFLQLVGRRLPSRGRRDHGSELSYPAFRPRTTPQQLLTCQ